MVPTQLTSKRRRSAVDAACRYPWVEGKDICGVVDVRSRDANQVDQVVNA